MILKNLPMVSKTHPTVPSPPQQMTLNFSTSLNICRPCIGPPVAKLWTCRGFRMYWNLRSIRSPCRPPDFGLMKTRRGIEPDNGVIWKDIAGCWFCAVDELDWVLNKAPWTNGIWFNEELPENFGIYYRKCRNCNIFVIRNY